MSAPEPTAEHVRLAREALPVNATPGQVNRIARALAAAEARGFERGKESAAKVADSVMHDTQMPWYVTKNNIVHAIRALKEPR